ncbi:MAG: PBP1A family penicillin-binding protein [Oscillospiraceae bacterium]|nr:PBP1A family penicillin-binding protein [Oscillospiraceae bacterium]
MDKEPKFKLHAGKAADTAADTVVGAVGLVAKIVVTVLLVILTTTLLLACVFAFYVKTCLTEDIDVSLSDYQLSESSIIYCETSAGEYKELATLHGSENRIWVDLEDIPDYLVKALVAIEDHRFYEHKGVDWYRTVGAMFTMLTGGDDSFGGSTITQQLIKNLTGNKEVTVQRKLIEIFQALEFEKKYDKDEIIEWYLNAVYFGEGCDGIYTAAQKYFGKEPSQLTLAESASIVGIVNLPTYYSPFYSEENNKERQETVLRRMYELGYISYDEYEEAKNEQLVFTRSDNEVADQEIYSYYVEAVIKDVTEDLMEQKGISQDTARQLLYNGGYRVYSCLDPYIQECVDNVYLDVENFPKPYRANDQQLQSAMVIMDPYTGEVVAMSGGVGEKTGNLVLNRATDALRAPGSSFKPLAVYAPAIELGLITPSTLVNDAPREEVEMSQNQWYPNNSDFQYRGIIDIATGVRLSLNTVAAQVLDKLGLDASTNFLKNKLGITSLVPDDYNYASLALGELTNGISVLEMAQAYCTFDNSGIFTEARTYSRVTDAAGNIVLDNQPKTHVAMKSSTATNITSLLFSAANYGTGSESIFSGQAIAGKTGTSSYNWNRWFAGYTPYYVGVVWTGFDQPEQMYVYGNPAAQVWRRVMQQVHAGLEYKSFPAADWIGGDTQIFGDLTEAKEEQDNPSPSPSEEPAASESPDAAVSESPSVSTAPVVTDSPVATEPPVEPVEPVEPPANGGVFG